MREYVCFYLPQLVHVLFLIQFGKGDEVAIHCLGHVFQNLIWVASNLDCNQ